MNKKNLVFLTLGILAFAGFGSAMLIAYISNSVTENVSVESPLVMQISNDGGVTYSDNVSVGTIYGGDSVIFKTSTQNMASADANATFELVISNDNNSAMCEDFTVATFNGVNMSGSCVNVNGEAIFESSQLYSAQATQFDDVVLTFAFAIAPANYTITSQIKMD